MANDGTVKIGTDLDESGLKKGLKSSEKEAKKTWEDLASQSGKTVEELKADAKKIAEEYQKQGMNIPNSYKRAYKEMGVYSNSAKEEMSEDADKIGDYNEKNADRSRSAWKKAFSGLGGFAKQGFSAISNAAATMAKVSAVAIGGMVTAVGGAGVAAYKFGTEYETSAAKVSTIADTTKVSMKELGDAVLNLSNETGTAATELNESLYSAISAGADTAHAVDLVEVAVKAARGGFTDTETAVDGLTSALNAYGMETSDAEGLANKFLVTQNLGKTTFGELASSIGGVAPTANAAGVSIDELLSGVASLTANGIGTSEAMTGIKAALSNVIKPSSEAAKMAAQLGLDFSTAALQSKGLAGFLDDVSTATGGNMDQMAQLFGSVEALNTVLTLTSDQGAALMNETLDEMASNTTALDDAYEAMSNTAEIHTQKIGNSFKNLGIAIYQDNKGPVADFTGLLADAAEDI